MDYSQEEIQEIINLISKFPNCQDQSELEVENILEEKYFIFELLGNQVYDPKNLRMILNFVKLYNNKYAKWRTEYYNHKQQIKQNQGVPFDFTTCKYQLSELEKLIMNNL